MQTVKKGLVSLGARSFSPASTLHYSVPTRPAFRKRSNKLIQGEVAQQWSKANKGNFECGIPSGGCGEGKCHLLQIVSKASFSFVGLLLPGPLPFPLFHPLLQDPAQRRSHTGSDPGSFSSAPSQDVNILCQKGSSNYCLKEKQPPFVSLALLCFAAAYVPSCSTLGLQTPGFRKCGRFLVLRQVLFHGGT